MLQDTSANPEMYLSKLPGGTPGGWGIGNDASNESQAAPINYSDLKECSVVWAVSIPGETEWFTDELDGAKTSKSPMLTIRIVCNKQCS
jgi:hypothetical protein